MIICHQCKGNGYVKVRFEAEQAIEQCSVCHSQGEINEDKYYHQTWTEGAEDSSTLYPYPKAKRPVIGVGFWKMKAIWKRLAALNLSYVEDVYSSGHVPLFADRGPRASFHL